MTQEQKTDRQRGHQANERTFLAWLRTSISLIALGFAITQFSLFLHQLKSSFSERKIYNNHIFNSDNIGIILVITGMIIILISAWNYNQVFRQIEQGNYQPNRLLVWMMTAIVIILGLMSLPLFFRRELPEKNVPSSLNLKGDKSLPLIAHILIGLRY